jgi:NTE family protein
MIAVLQEASDPGHSEGARWAKMRIHRIASEIMTEIGYSSKLNAEWDFLCMLRDEGAGRHTADLGVRSTFDVAALRELS